MARIKLLWIASENMNQTIFPQHRYFVAGLSELIDVHVSHDSGKIKDIIRKCGVDPDVIYLHEYRAWNAPVVTELSDLDIPVVAQVSDIHRNIHVRKKSFRDDHIKHIFTVCRDKFIEWFPEFVDCMTWMPHHVNTNVFKDYSLKKDIDLLMTGSTSRKWYPLRAEIARKFKKKKGFVQYPHAKHQQRRKASGKANFVGENYAKALNRAKICFACDLILRYPVKKYYEIPACNALLLASYSPELRDLGFISEENFVEINKDNFKRKAYYYLKNDSERSRIAMNGMRLVHENHSTKKRVHEFLAEIERIISLY